MLKEAKDKLRQLQRDGKSKEEIRTLFSQWNEDDFNVLWNLAAEHHHSNTVLIVTALVGFLVVGVVVSLTMLTLPEISSVSPDSFIEELVETNCQDMSMEALLECKLIGDRYAVEECKRKLTFCNITQKNIPVIDRSGLCTSGSLSVDIFGDNAIIASNEVYFSDKKKISSRDLLGQNTKSISAPFDYANTLFSENGQVRMSVLEQEGDLVLYTLYNLIDAEVQPYKSFQHYLDRPYRVFQYGDRIYTTPTLNHTSFLSYELESQDNAIEYTLQGAKDRRMDMILVEGDFIFVANEEELLVIDTIANEAYRLHNFPDEDWFYGYGSLSYDGNRFYLYEWESRGYFDTITCEDWMNV